MLGLPITTGSLVLRRFVLEDAEAILQLNAEPSTRLWLPSHVYSSSAEAQAALEFLISAYSSPGDPQRGPYVLAVECAGDRQLLGHVGFSPIDGEVEVSYSIAESARGRGLGAQAVAGACAWVNDAFGVRTVIALTATENIPSRRTLERAGFVHAWDEGIEFQGVHQTVSRYSCTLPVRVTAATS